MKIQINEAKISQKSKHSAESRLPVSLQVNKLRKESFAVGE